MDFLLNSAYALEPGTPVQDPGVHEGATDVLLTFGLSATMLAGFVIVLALVAFAVLAAGWSVRRRGEAR